MRTSLGLVLLAFGMGCGATVPPPTDIPLPTASSIVQSPKGSNQPSTAPIDETATHTGFVPDSEAVGRSDALALASSWFEALRRADVAGLVATMNIPSVIQGFVLETGPRADECGARPDTNVVGIGIERQVTTSAELHDALSCLVLDNLLVGSVPSSAGSTWPQDHRNFREGNVGSLEVIASDNLANPLPIFLPRLAPLARTHALAQAIMTDNNGVINHVALAITAHRPARVDAVYIHEEFRE